MWLFWGKGASGFSGYSTAEQVTHGIDGSGLTAIVTGASRGIGAETTRVLALRGVHVIMAVRNTEAGRKTREEIVKEIPEAKVEVMELDLSSLSSVRKFASEYKASNRPLHLLINNAGIMGLPFMLSKDDIELQFATNHLGHFLLTNLLLDTMKQTSSKSHREGRIVNVSSIGHWLAYSEGIRFDNLNDPQWYSPFRAYGQSKLANILHALQLSKHLKEDGAKITTNSVHPGAISTDLYCYNRWADVFNRVIDKHFFKNVPQGAATTCYVALHPQVTGISGGYFSNCNLSKTSSQARDASLAQNLWDFSMDLVKNKQYASRSAII